jgi:hypothetical protein
VTSPNPASESAKKLICACRVFGNLGSPRIRSTSELDLVADRREGGRVNVVVASAPVVGRPHNPNIAGVEHTDVVQGLVYTGS